MSAPAKGPSTHARSQPIDQSSVWVYGSLVQGDDFLAGKTSRRALSAEALTALDIHAGPFRVSVDSEDSEGIVRDFLQVLDAL